VAVAVFVVVVFAILLVLCYYSSRLSLSECHVLFRRRHHALDFYLALMVFVRLVVALADSLCAVVSAE